MAVAIPFVMLGLSAVSAIGAKNAADDQASAAEQAAAENKVYADWQAANLKKQANSERATAQRKAIEEKRQAGLAISRATALAAASGGGVSDPTVTNILGNLAGEGEYNALADLYEGETSARGYEDQAAALQWQADLGLEAGATRANALRDAGTMSAIGQIGSAAGSFYGKYGGGTTDATTTGVSTAGYRPDISQRSGGLY